jgi:hypothetical protein
MASLVALLVMRFSDVGARILHDFPRQARQSTASEDRNDQQSQT